MIFSPKFFMLCGAGLAFLAISLGAFGAHALKQKIDKEMLAVFEVGVRYHMFHALSLFVIAWALTYFVHPLISISGLLLLFGTLIFSGSLYILALTSIRYWGAITPIGGVILLLGWLLFAIGVWKSPT